MRRPPAGSRRSSRRRSKCSRTRPTSPPTWRRRATTRPTARASRPKSATGRCTRSAAKATASTRTGPGSTTPTSSFNSSNYWVDVLFVPEPAATVPAAPTGVERDGRRRLRDGQLDRARLQRRQPDHRLQGRPLQSRRRPDRDDGRRRSDDRQHQRPDRGLELHVQSGGDQHRRHRARIGGLERGDADRGDRTGRPDRIDRGGEELVARR